MLTILVLCCGIGIVPLPTLSVYDGSTAALENGPHQLYRSTEASAGG